MVVNKQIIRVLNKLKILHFFNLEVSYSYNSKKYIIPIINKVGREIMWNDFAESWLVDLVKKLPGIDNITFIDVGVNLGQTLLGVKTLSAQGAKYIGFEPNPACITYLEHLINSNNFNNCTIMPCALSSDSNLLSFIISSDTDDAGSIVEELRPDKYKKKEQYVCALKFDDLSLSKNINNPVIKIDVEGAELDVIKGMQGFIKSNRPLIICEVLHAHSADQLTFCEKRNNEMVEILTLTGYKIFRIIKTAATTAVTGFESITTFDKAVYGATSSTVCDYIFLPKEKNIGDIINFNN